ncbi:hypothetical protein GCM10018954_046860 [Kutzneria kofuensis]
MAAVCATTSSAAAVTLPGSFRWNSGGVVISPRSDSSHSLVSIKDPSVVRYNNRWYVYASTVNSAGKYSMATVNFTDWSQAASAPTYHLDTNPNIGSRYAAAPQLFYFAPQHKWYLVYQTGPPSFSTASDPGRPDTWSAPQHFFAAEPPIVTQNKGSHGWIDFWVICDSANCYLFFSDDNGHLYRSRTSVANFPDGFTDTTIVLQDSNKFHLFEASNVYKLKGQNGYLLLVEAIGSDGRRYFRSWTAGRLDGAWTPLADTESNPFARADNVTFTGPAWTKDFSHGEMIRDGYDQTLTIDPCHLQYLYQGKDPSASGPYTYLPWRLGLLTQTGSSC